jgi:hypothetical protein
MLLLKNVGVQADLRGYRELHRGPKIKYKGPWGKFENTIKPSVLLLLEIEILRRQTATMPPGNVPLGDGAQDRTDGRSRAAVERQPYCRWVRRHDGEKPPLIAGEELLNQDRRCWHPKPALPATTMDA